MTAVTRTAIHAGPDDLADFTAQAVGGIAADGPGCVVRVSIAGELVAAAAVGFADIDAGIRVDQNTVMPVASVGKQFTGAVLAVLEADGLVAANGRLGEWFPELAPALADVAVHELVHQTSGLRDFLTLAAVRGMSEAELVDAAAPLALVVAEQDLQFPPGSRHDYSNSNYVLLAELVHRVTGSTLAEMAGQLFFQPLGMDSTSFGHSPPDGGAASYVRTSQGWAPRPSPPAPPGPAGLFTTATDLARWHRELLTNSELLGRLTRTRPLRPSDGDNPYAYGVVHERLAGQAVAGHSGFLPGQVAHTLLAPARDVSVVVIANCAEIPAVSIARTVMTHALGGDPAAADRHAKPPRAGWYVTEDFRSALLVSHGADSVRVTREAAAFELRQVDDRWVATDGAPAMQMAADTLTLSAQWLPPVTFRPVHASDPSLPCAGHYVNDDLGIYIEIDGDQIRIGDQQLTLEQMENGVWWAPMSLLGLTPGLVLRLLAEGALEVNAFRAHGLRFSPFEAGAKAGSSPRARP